MLVSCVDSVVFGYCIADGLGRDEGMHEGPATAHGAGDSGHGHALQQWKSYGVIIGGKTASSTLHTRELNM